MNNGRWGKEGDPVNRALRQAIDGMESSRLRRDWRLRMVFNDVAGGTVLAEAGILMKYDFNTGLEIAAAAVALNAGFKLVAALRTQARGN